MAKKSPTEPKPSSHPDPLSKTSDNAKVELEERDLENVTGGAPTFQDIHFTSTVNKGSP